MEFHLAAQACLSQFTIVIYGVANLSFNVTRAEAAKGTVIYNLDPDIISPVNICDVKSVIYGGNEIGNSAPFDILLPKCKPSLPKPISITFSHIYIVHGAASTNIVPTPKTTTAPSSGPPPTNERTSGISLAVVVGPGMKYSSILVQ